MIDRIIKKRTKYNKLIGYIREIEPFPPYSCKYQGKRYVLCDPDDEYIDSFDKYEKAYNALYEMEV